MNTKISPSFGLQAMLFNQDLINTPLQAKGSFEFTRKSNAIHTIYDADGCAYTVLRTLVDCQTSHQRVEIVVTPKFGKMLFLDGVVMSSEVDQDFYHEHLVVPALYNVLLDNVLLLGAGPRGVLTPLLRLDPQHIVAVDIDQEATTIYQKYLPEWFANKDDPKIEFRYEDAILFLKNSEAKFDAIICDLTFGADTFTDDLLTLLKERLTPTGVLLSHYGAASFLDGTTPLVKNKFKKHFPFVKTWNAFVPSFGDLWGWVAASMSNPTEVANAAGWVRLEKMRWVTKQNIWQLLTTPSYDVE